MEVNDQLLKQLELKLPRFYDIFDRKSDIFKQFGVFADDTDLSKLTGGARRDIDGGYGSGEYALDDRSYEGTTGYVNVYGQYDHTNRLRRPGVRPILKLPDELFSEIIKDKRSLKNGGDEVDFGEYPQDEPPGQIVSELEREFQAGKLKQTGKHYTFDCIDPNRNYRFQPVKYAEYEYKGKKYIRVRANSRHRSVPLGNGKYVDITYSFGDCVWLEVTPVTWLIDYEHKSLISKKILLSGIKNMGSGRDKNGLFFIKSGTQAYKHGDWGFNYNGKRYYIIALGFNYKKEGDLRTTVSKNIYNWTVKTLLS